MFILDSVQIETITQEQRVNKNHKNFDKQSMKGVKVNGVYVCKQGLKDSTIVVIIIIREFHGEKTQALILLLGSLNAFLTKQGGF